MPKEEELEKSSSEETPESEEVTRQLQEISRNIESQGSSDQESKERERAHNAEKEMVISGFKKKVEELNKMIKDFPSPFDYEFYHETSYDENSEGEEDMAVKTIEGKAVEIANWMKKSVDDLYAQYPEFKDKIGALFIREADNGEYELCVKIK